MTYFSSSIYFFTLNQASVCERQTERERESGSKEDSESVKKKTRKIKKLVLRKERSASATDLIYRIRGRREERREKGFQ